MRGLSVSMFAGSVIALCMGFYKMFAYSNPESLYGDLVNAYVGSDAANFTINASYTIGYFVLFGALLIAGLLVEMMTMYMKNNKRSIEVDGLPVFDKQEIESDLQKPIDEK